VDRRKTMIIDRKKLKRTKRPEYFYHITEQKWSKKITLTPRVHGFKRGGGEPCIARTCVGPSVAYCLASTVLDSSNFRVYRTKKKILSYYPVEVEDSMFTREKWLLDPTLFTHICNIPDDLITEIWNNGLDGTNGDILRGKIPKIRSILRKYNFPEYS